MSDVTYMLTGIDEFGDTSVEVLLTKERAMQILMEEIAAGRAKIVGIDNEPEKPARKTKKTDKKHAKKAKPASEVGADEKDSEEEAGWVETGEADPLSREDFDKVREGFETLGSSQDVAESLGLPVAEVNRAVKFRQYAAYTRNRLSN